MTPLRSSKPGRIPDPSILIIDDDVDVLEATAEIFRAQGYAVTVAANGRHAEVLIRFRRFDLVLTDVLMPELTGIEVLEGVKRHSPTTEVLLMTGYATRALATEALAKGACGVLEKPVFTDYLLARAREALQRGRLRSEFGHGDNEAQKFSPGA